MLFKKQKNNDCYITTAIDYVNSIPHIGTAYEKIGADVYARYQRMLGKDVWFQMGNDEHSINVKKSADKAGLDPKIYCDGMEEKFTQVWKDLNISYNGFIRTTETRHKKSVQELFQKILDNKDIYQDTYEGWYCESCEAFLTDKDLEDGKCPNHKTKPKWLKEKNYFFALSKYQDKLLKHIKKHPEFILPAARRNEVVKMIEMGLQNISVSRSSVDWGIPLPHDNAHVVYVWFDALINYITAIGFAADEAKFKKWWPASMHIIGKDIIRFHCVIWPAMLMAAGIALPKTIFAHGFVYLKGEKMSKSLGNVLTPLDVTKKYGEDALRYYLLRESPFGKDSDFTWEHFINRYNGELANGLGNLVSRTLGMAGKYLDGVIPETHKPNHPTDNELKDKILKLPEEVAQDLTPQNGGIFFNNALAHIWEGMTAADVYINENKPWELNKAGNINRIKEVLSNVTEAIRIITILIYPFVPKSGEKIWEIFNFDSIKALKDTKFSDAKEWDFITCNLKTKKAENLFPRIESTDNRPKTEDQRPKIGDKMDKVNRPKSRDEGRETMDNQQSSTSNQQPATSNLIDIGEFAKVELKIGKVTEACKIDGADKLLKLQVNLGDETRQIVAGIALAYSPEELVGQKVAVVTNLKPVKLRGVESQGMLLAASKGNELTILTPQKDIPVGSKIK